MEYVILVVVTFGMFLAWRIFKSKTSGSGTGGSWKDTPPKNDA